MANYDAPGLSYDSGVLYDQADLPQNTRKTMAKVKLNLSRFTDDQLVQKASDIKAALTGNTNFTTPVPALTAVATLITTAQAKLASFNAAQAAAKQATTEKNVAMDALRAALAQWGTYVELTSGGVAAKIQSAQMDVQSPRTPATVPNQVLNLTLTASEAAGSVDSQWDPIPNAKSYEIQISPEPMTASSWVNHPPATKSKAVLTALTSGARVWVRVRAVGAAGQGAWSDPATKIVP